jgi:hypothetical protein
MDSLAFQSLIGIILREGEKLTPVSSDVFISIPDRDFYLIFLDDESPPCLKNSRYLMSSL